MNQIKLLLAVLAIVMVSCKEKSEFVIGNEALSRTVSIAGEKLHTLQLDNKLAGKALSPANSDEFMIRISEGTDIEGTDVILTAADFTVEKVLTDAPQHLAFLLHNKANQLDVEVHYVLKPGATYLHKFMVVKPQKRITLEKIDVECVALDDLYQPYQMKQITAWGPARWRPGLGQPLYTKESATYWGLEFPASNNEVVDGTGYCGYLWGKTLEAGASYKTYQSVFGVGDDAAFMQDAFFDYIDQIRIRPLRLQVQYNSWFDFGPRVTKASFANSVAKVNQELCLERDVPPLRAYVIDDGWQDARADWSNKVWQVNTERFDADFTASSANVKAAGSTLGLWLSPGCNFGGRPAVKQMREKGLEALDQYMSLAGPQYMQLLEERMVELTQQGISYFKLDGLFGHLNRREFELNGQRYGMPVMPQLGTEGLAPADSALNSSLFDELKTYYLVAGTERLMEIFEKQHAVNPDVYIVISNGAYLSPWWLMYTDAIWMINAGDAARGSDRNQELVYRDGVYYDTWVKEKTQFPINSVFNHEPKKTRTGESAQQFSEYLWMNLSRGTGFVELYIKTDVLSESDWDVLANGLKWTHKVFPYFKHAKMHGGNPVAGEVYGYTGWNENGGYASFHNPADQAQTYSMVLNRAFGVRAANGSYTCSSPLANGKAFEGKHIAKDDSLQITLEPGEVKVLEFTQEK